MGRKGNKRERILRVAEEVFAGKNFSGATMREIAEGAEMLKPGLYHYFRNKEDIYNTLILDIYSQLRRRVLEPLSHVSDTREKLKLFATLLVDFWSDHPRFPRIIAQEVIWGSELVSNELIPKFLVPMFREFVEEIEERDLERSGMRDVDMPLLVFNVFGMSIFYFFSGPIFNTLTGEDYASPRRIEKLKQEMVGLILHGLRKEGPGGSP